VCGVHVRACACVCVCAYCVCVCGVLRACVRICVYACVREVRGRECTSLHIIA
jgi:hypothetical protein